MGACVVLPKTRQKLVHLQSQQTTLEASLAALREEFNKVSLHAQDLNWTG